MQCASVAKIAVEVGQRTRTGDDCIEEAKTREREIWAKVDEETVTEKQMGNQRFQRY